MEKRLPVQVQVMVYRRTAGGDMRVLALRRTEYWGGFWQPVTGGTWRGETLEETAAREVREETGIEQPLRLFSLDYVYTFALPDRYRPFYEPDVKILTEHSYAYETDIENVVLSAEHTEHRWLTPDEAAALYEYEEYGESVRRLAARLDEETAAQ